MSWTQEGRERKAKELAKSEQYAEKGVGAAGKRSRKPYIIEWKYTQYGWDYVQTHMQWFMRWHKDNEWEPYRKYARKSDAEKAMLALQARDPQSKEYRLKEKV